MTRDYLKTLMHYDPDTGIFTRLTAVARNTKVGDEVGTDAGKGHLRTGIDGKYYFMHRLAFIYMTGKFPNHSVDHINGDRADNRWCNLRDVPCGENSRNAKRCRNNKSGVTGVTWSAKSLRWRSFIGVSGQIIYLGSFTNKESAISVRKSAERIYGYHPNHGRVV